jgi:glutamine synthetase
MRLSAVIHNQIRGYKKHLRSTHAVSNPEANSVKSHALVAWPQFIIVWQTKELQ